MATQNPIEQEGTYPLPEAQLDRFLMHVYVDYPAQGAELDIMLLVRSEEEEAAGGSKADSPMTAQDAIFEARREIHAVQVADAVAQYMVALIEATRYPEKYDKDPTQMDPDRR